MILIFFIFGILIGSFLNVVILRLPKEERLTGRSHCPNCAHQLGPGELIPLLSYIFLAGRCSQCRCKISPRYFIIELSVGILFAAASCFYPPADLGSVMLLLKAFLIIAALTVVFVIDLEHYLIFDSVVFLSAAGIIVLNLFSDIVSGMSLFSLNSHTLGGIICGLAFSGLFYLGWLASSGRALGFGDVKLALFLGLAVGWPLTWLGLFLSVMLGGAVSLFLLFFRLKGLKSHVPFGTFLAMGWVITLFWGEKILRWYLALLGF